MKRFLSLTVFACLCSCSPGFGQQVISFWDFNDGFSVADDSAQIVHNASIGTGIIYQQRAETDGNGKGGVDYANALFGIDVEGDRSIAWNDVARSGDNDAELFVTFSTTGFENIALSFDARGNADGGIVSYDIKYDTNPLQDINFEGNTIKDFADGNSTTFGNNTSFTPPADDFSRFTIDLAGVALANDQSVFAVRFDDIDENDALRFDNFLVTGTAIAIPEPSSLVLTGAGCLFTTLRRRKNA
jgi:hypothetical protein